ncbi:MAG TPA: hypothetical protein VFX28_01665, partial [Methylomirabilota bacterium]|nr:hypothetical protein [Methylomirabilota bacterium]
IGSWIGFAHRTEAPVYIAPRGPEHPAAPIASSTPPDTAAALELLGATSDSSSHRAGPVSAATPAVSNAPPTPEVEEACRQLFPDDLMRVEGRFGLFVGRASTITPRAIEGLRPELPEYAAPTLRSLAWEQVDRLDVRRNGAVRGAVRGAAITTALTLVCTGVAIALEGGVPSGEGPHLYQFTLYFGFLAIPVGTVIGTVAGAANPYWQKVYRRP